MMRIYKYKLAVTDDQRIKLHGMPLSVVSQFGNDVTLYATYNDVTPELEYDIHIAGTGHPLPADISSYIFLGTVMLSQLGLVFHVFYRPVH